MSRSASSQWQRILEEEESLWRRGHPCFETSDHHDMQLSLLDQCPNIPKIHGYFSNLELRKCCLKLAGANTTFSTMRVVGSLTRSSFSSQSGGGVWATRQTENGQLTDRDFTVYQAALFCANFPVLSVPDPPTEPTPTFSWEERKGQGVHNTEGALTGRRGYSRQRSLLSPVYSTQEGRKASNTPAELYESLRYRVQHQSMEASHSRSNSQTSGVESMCSASSSGLCDEDESMAVLPPESLCEWLRRMFGLTQDANRQYEKKIYLPHRKKTFAKILVEELCKQLSMLESDTHPFYNSKMFMSREAYTRWQHQERSRIGHMIQKFWHHSLPTVKGSSHLEVAQYHEHYRHLLKKVITFEGHLRGSQTNGGQACIMSSVSRRLLKEFSCRHGIGEFYQKIVFLELLSDNFSSSIAYTHQVIAQLLEVKQLLPKQMGKSVLVATEYEILSNTLTGLQAHCKHILTRIKRIYEESQILNGVGNMIQLLALLVELKAQLDVDNSPTVKQLLCVFTKENVHGSYERHKVIARGDLELDTRTEDITPKLINRLIINIKDEVCDYKRNYAPAFQRYLDVVQFAAGVLYDLLMEDVTSLCVTSNQKQSNAGISLPLLGLVYRLDQLDRDPCWQELISPVQQTWRREFFSLVLKWEKMLEKHAEKFLLQCVGADRFVTLRPVLIPTLDEHVVAGSRCTSTQSHASIAVSEFSAFSAFRNHCSPASVQERLSCDCDDQGTGASDHSEDEDIARDILTFQTTKLSRLKKSDSLLLATDLVPERCASAPIKFVSFMCDVGGSGTGAERNTRDSGQRQDTDKISENCDKTRIEGGNKECGSKGEISKGTAVENCKSQDFRRYPEETALGKQWTEQGQRKTEGFTNVSGSKEDLSSQLAFTGTRKLRSQSLREERSKKRSHSVLDFNIPEKSSLPLYRSLPQRPQVQMAEADIGNALLENGEFPEDYSQTLNVSSSAVEVVMVLKRMTHTVKTLCDTLYPNQKATSVLDSQLEEGEDFIHIKQNIIMRWKLYTSLTEMISETVSLYTYNMLSMDVCGESNLRAKQILGPHVVAELKSLYAHKRVWGCRHMASGQDCKAFSNKRSVTYLADKYEPVTREMCTRVNNLVELSYLLEDLFSMARQSLCLHHTVEAAKCCHLVLDDESFVRSQRVNEQVKEGWTALVHLMVYRLLLFVKEAMNMLQQLEVTSGVTMEFIYHPVIRFIRNYSIALHAWLNDEVYEMFVRQFWDKLMDLFEDLVTELIDQEQMQSITAERLLQLIAHLMKLLCETYGRLDLDYAESRAEKCLDILSLCTAPTIRLILVYRILTTETQLSEVESYADDSQSLPPKSYLQSMYRDLHQSRKCFSGAQLVNWIMLNPLEDHMPESPNKSKRNGPRAEHGVSSHSRLVESDEGLNRGSRARPHNGQQWSLRGFDLARAQNTAKHLLKKGVIYQLDKSTQGSFIQDADVYPDVVHCGTSALSKLRSSSFSQGLNQQTEGRVFDTNHTSTPVFLKKKPLLKRAPSAPQFSLGVASPIDVTVLKSELEFRQYQNQLLSDSDSCTEGQLTLNERTRRRIEKLMQNPTDSSAEETDHGRNVNHKEGPGNIARASRCNGEVSVTVDSNSSQISNKMQDHSEEMQESSTSNAFLKKHKNTENAAHTTAEQIDVELLQKTQKENVEHKADNSIRDFVTTAEVHKPDNSKTSQHNSGNQDISVSACDKAISSLEVDHSEMPSVSCMNHSVPNSKDINEHDDVENDDLSSTSTIKDKDAMPSDYEPHRTTLSHDHVESLSSRHSPGGVGHTSDSSVQVDHWRNTSEFSGEYGLSSSLESSTSGSTFQNTSHHYYSFSDGTEHLGDCLEHVISFLDHMTSSEGEHFQQQLSKDIDLFQKQHPCFGYQFSTQHVEPKFILQILKCRRSYDSVAKHFLLLLPGDKKVQFGMLEESVGAGCFGFL